MPNSPSANTLFHGDMLEAARYFQPSSVALIYLDPPFFTGKDFQHRGAETGGFTDRWESLEDYLSFLRERIRALRELLTPEGSFLLHLDWRTVHYAKVMCDEIFGMDRFQNELIWSYNSGGGSKKRYGRKHDTILWYSNGKNPTFNREAARVPYDAIIAKKRAHLFHSEGKVSGDVLSISRPPNHAKEWTGWPTQKPLELLRFLVRIHSNPDDIVGDCCCGSGTTLVAAAREGRRYVGADLSDQALDLARGRLAALADDLTGM